MNWSNCSNSKVNFRGAAEGALCTVLLNTCYCGLELQADPSALFIIGMHVLGSQHLVNLVAMAL